MFCIQIIVFKRFGVKGFLECLYKVKICMVICVFVIFKVFMFDDSGDVFGVGLMNGELKICVGKMVWEIMMFDYVVFLSVREM